MTFKIEIPLSKFPLHELLKEVSKRKDEAGPFEKAQIHEWLKKESKIKKVAVYGN